MVKLTKQGVRDLGGGRPRRIRQTSVCPHLWEPEVRFDCRDEVYRVFHHCGFCQETR